MRINRVSACADESTPERAARPGILRREALGGYIVSKLVWPGPNPRRYIHLWPSPRRYIYLLISIAYHRRYGRAVSIDPVVLRAITISWNNIVIPVRSCPDHRHPDDRPWFTNDFGLGRMRCGTEHPHVTQHQGRSESCGHHPHASASLPHRPNSDIRRRSTSRRC
jgi:hypothetical protein